MFVLYECGCGVYVVEWVCGGDGLGAQDWASGTAIAVYLRSWQSW